MEKIKLTEEQEKIIDKSIELIKQFNCLDYDQYAYEYCWKNEICINTKQEYILILIATK